MDEKEKVRTRENILKKTFFNYKCIPNDSDIDCDISCGTRDRYVFLEDNYYDYYLSSKDLWYLEDIGYIGYIGYIDRYYQCDKISQRNTNFYYSQKRENLELESILDEIDNYKTRK